MNNKHVAIRIPESMVEQMREYAKETGSSVSDYIRQALAAQIKADALERAQYKQQLMAVSESPARHGGQ